MTDRRKQTPEDAWENFCDALLEPFVPMVQALAKLLEGSNDEQGTQERD